MYKLLFIPFGCLLLAACGKNGSQAKSGPAIVTDTAAAPVHEVMGIAMIEPSARITALSAQSKGIVRQIFVQIGQPLHAGQPILALDAAVETAQMGQANSKIAAQNDAVQVAQENLRLLNVQLAKAKDDLSRDESLFNGNARTKQALDDSRYQVASLQQQIRAQEAALQQQISRIGELKADIRYAQTLAAQKTVKAPAKGTLLSLDAKVGAFLDSNAPIGDFAPEGPVIALTEIDELFADRIRVGQRARIRPQGKTETLTTGTVVLASPYLRKKSLFSDSPDDLEDRRIREIRVQLDDPGKVLLGARVECVIQID